MLVLCLAGIKKETLHGLAQQVESVFGIDLLLSSAELQCL